MKNILSKLSLRVRLTLWYGTIVAITITLFGILTYQTVSRSLRSNLDASLERVALSLEYIIKSKQSNKPLAPPTRKKRVSAEERLTYFTQQLARLQSEQNKIRQREKSRMLHERLRTRSQEIERSKDSIPTITKDDSLRIAKKIALDEDNELDVVWSAVYQHILLNSKNFYIQIADSSNRVYWQSVNLDNSKNTSSLPFYTALESSDENNDKKVFMDFTADDQILRVFVIQTPVAQIAVGYAMTEIEDTLSELFAVLKFGFPIALAVALIGGYFLARYSLRSVDMIAHAAQEITAHNLSKRLPMPVVNDEIARLTSTLNEMIGRLEQSFNQIRQFTGDASHELRTPLAILMGELELVLRRDRPKEEYQVAIISSLEEVNRLSTVVQNLLEISRAESGQVPLRIELLDMSILANEVCDDLEYIAEERSIRLERVIQPFVSLKGDSGRLHQVLLNLIENAIKYTLSGGCVSVDIHMETTNTIIVISDTGIGIPPEDIPFVFDRFYRVDKARSQDIQGNGLGLSIVKWIVEAHQGTISIASELGVGSTITIILPAEPETSEAQRTQPLTHQETF